MSEGGTDEEEEFYDCLDEPSTPETHDDEESWRDALDTCQHQDHIEGGNEAPAQEDSSGCTVTVCTHTEDQAAIADKQAERICTSSQASISGQSDFPAHRAAFYGEQEALLSLLRQWPVEQQQAFDPQGNTVLHVAVLRNHHELVQALLDVGFPPAIRNARRWAALEEAVGLRDRRMVKLLHAAEVAAGKALHRANRGDLLATMREMPDYTFKLKWELGSPVLGLLLRRYAPHDTYEVWKKGTCMRVDGSLMGIDDKAGTLLPTWKRGHFSLLFDGAPQPASLLLIDHRKRTVVDLASEKKKHRPDIDDEVALIMSEGCGQGRTKMKASDFRFARVKSWLGGDATERIEGWKTYVYEAAGKMKAVNITKAAVELPPEATFEDYLATSFEEDEVSESYIDPLSLKGAPKAVHNSHEDGAEQPANGKSAAELERAARTLTGRCWMAENFPMSLRQLLPVLDVVGAANKHLARVGRFLQKYGDMDLFPVKLQVPLLWTVYALVSFRNFHMLTATGEASRSAFYQPPPEYTRKALHESLSKGKKAPRGLANGSLADLEEGDFY